MQIIAELQFEHSNMFIYLFIYLFIKLRHSHGYKQVAGSPQQCTPITVGPSKIIKYGQLENITQLIAIQHHTVQYNTIQYMYNTIHHNRIQYYSKNKIQLPPPLPPPAAEYLVYRANQLHVCLCWVFFTQDRRPSKKNRLQLSHMPSPTPDLIQLFQWW